MSIFSKIKNPAFKQTIPYVGIENSGRTLSVGGRLVKKPNSLVDLWDLTGYEIHGGSVSLVDPKGKSSVGYVCDETGVTVTLRESIIEPGEPVNSADLRMNVLDNLEYRFKAEQVPFVLISEKATKLTWGGRIRRKGQLLTDGPGLPVYRIAGNMIEIRNIATGKTEMGYLCHDSGITVEINRGITIERPADLPENRNPVLLIPKAPVVKIEANFSGAVGRVSSFDRIVEIFDVGQSKKQLVYGIILGAVGMFFLRLFF